MGPESRQEAARALLWNEVGARCDACGRRIGTDDERPAVSAGVAKAGYCHSLCLDCALDPKLARFFLRVIVRNNKLTVDDAIQHIWWQIMQPVNGGTDGTGEGVRGAGLGRDREG